MKKGGLFSLKPIRHKRQEMLSQTKATSTRIFHTSREERCSFAVGTDRPARRRPAALDRPVTPGPYCRAGCRLSSQNCVLDVHDRQKVRPAALRFVRTVCLASSVIARRSSCFENLLSQEEAVVLRRDTQIRRFE